MKLKLNVLIALALLCGSGLFAQEEAEAEALSPASEQQNSAQAVVATDLEQTRGEQYAEIRQFKLKNSPRNELQKIKKEAKLSDLKKGRFSDIAERDIGVKPGTEEYVTNRMAAFAWAELLARQKVATSIRARISSAMKSAMKNGEVKAADLESNEELKNALNSVIREELIAKGVDLTDEAAVKKAMPKITESSSFQRKVNVQVYTFLVGVTPYATLSSDDKVGVLVYSSNTLREIAQDMANGTTHTYPAGRSLDDYVEKISDQEMVNTYGLRAIINENGEPCLVAFAQWPVSGSDDSAISAAGYEASAMIREFVGMAIMANSDQSVKMDAVYYRGAEQAKPQAMAKAQAKFKQECEAIAEGIEFGGIPEITSGVIELPSGDELAYCVKYWTPTSAKIAAAAHAQGLQQQQTLRSKGGVMTTPPPPEKKKPVAAPAAQQPINSDNVRKNQGAAGKGAMGDAL